MDKRRGDRVRTLGTRKLATVFEFDKRRLDPCRTVPKELNLLEFYDSMSPGVRVDIILLSPVR